MDTFLLSRRDSDQHVIAVYGELAFPATDDLSQRLRRLAAGVTGEILLDLSQVTFMDCAGLRLLADFDLHVRSAGGSLRVAAVSPAAALLFELVDPPSRPVLIPPDVAPDAPAAALTR